MTELTYNPENPQNDPWRTMEGAVNEIREHRKPVQYVEIFNNKQIVFLGDSHDNSAIRLHIAQHAEKLRAAGVTHFTIEAKDNGKPVFDKLNQGENVDLSGVDVGPAEKAFQLSKLGSLAQAAASGINLIEEIDDPYAGRAGDEHAIRAIAKAGIKVVPIDIDQSTDPTREEREQHLTEGILQIVRDNPDAKVAVLIGGIHALKEYQIEGVASVAQRISREDHSITTVQFAGGRSDMPKNVTESARTADATHEEFILDLQPYEKSQYVPYGAGEADYIIHLPQIRDPNKESMNFRQPYRMPEKRYNFVGEFLKQLKKSDLNK